jgi:hypothetical protein
MSQQEQEIDEWTQKLEALLLKIALTAEKAGKSYYIGGGFAVDLIFGAISRPHEDIDFHPVEEDTQWWKDWFTSQGYSISKDPDMKDYPYAFLLTNEKHEYLADVYPVKIDKDGTISVTHTTAYQGRPWWKGKSWQDVQQIIYKGQKVKLEKHISVLQQKVEHYRWHGGTPEGKHLYDFQRAGIEPKI